MEQLASHTAAEFAVRAAVKTELFYRNYMYTTTDFFFEANKNKDNAKVALASSDN